MTVVRELAQLPVVVASADESVRDAGERMHAMALPCLPVFDDKGDMVGVLTIWDARRAHPNRLVIDAMTKRFPTTISDTSVWDAYFLLNQSGAEHLAVMEADRLFGIVSRTDLEISVARLTDALTGLPTAPHLRQRIRSSWTAKKDTCLLFIDINNFGEFNKIRGHAAGDQALRTLSKILASQCEPDRDVLCRYGGDEFAILTERPAAEVQRFAASILEEISETAARLDTPVAVGIAKGRRWSTDPVEDGQIDNFINIASLASTKAKRGTNRFVIVDAAVGLGDSGPAAVATHKMSTVQR